MTPGMNPLNKKDVQMEIFSKQKQEKGYNEKKYDYAGQIHVIHALSR